MAKDFAIEFYSSRVWRETREVIFRRDHGLCVRCGAPGSIVHHKIYITPRNINIQHIALGEDNLETLCRDCHAMEHEGELSTDSALIFDSNGNLIEKEQRV